MNIAPVGAGEGWAVTADRASGFFPSQYCVVPPAVSFSRAFAVTALRESVLG
jgi:hypothetical protein